MISLVGWPKLVKFFFFFDVLRLAIVHMLERTQVEVSNGFSSQKSPYYNRYVSYPFASAAQARAWFSTFKKLPDIVSHRLTCRLMVENIQKNDWN